MDINLPRQRERTCVGARLTRAARGTGRTPPDSVSDPVVYKLASHSPAGASLSSHASAWDLTRASQYKPPPASARVHSHQCSMQKSHSPVNAMQVLYECITSRAAHSIRSWDALVSVNMKQQNVLISNTNKRIKVDLNNKPVMCSTLKKIIITF